MLNRVSKRDGAADRIQPYSGPLTQPAPDLPPDGMVGTLVRLAQRGCTQQQAAAEMNVTRRTLQKWFKRWPFLREAWDAAADLPNREVEATLVDMLTTTERRSERVHHDAAGNVTGKTVTTETCPPDAKLLRWFLERRAPKRWAKRTMRVVVVDDKRFQPREINLDEVRDLVSGTEWDDAPVRLVGQAE